MITRGLPPQTPLKTEESDSAMLSSAFEDGVISLLTTGFDMLRKPLPELTTANGSDSASVIQRCRQQLAPVLFMSAKSQDSSTNLDINDCAAMLTDDHCREFLQQARNMKLQMDALAPCPQDNSRVIAVDINEETLKRGRDEDDHYGLSRTTRVRVGSGDDMRSIVLRKDSEATLVNSPIDHKASTFAQDTRQHSVQDITPPDKKVMEYDHDRSSTDVQASAIASAPLQMPTLASAVTVEDIEMTTCHSPDSRPTQTEHAQNMSSCSFADSRAPSSLVTMQIRTWFKRQGLTRPGILDIEFVVEECIIPATSPSGYARLHQFNFMTFLMTSSSVPKPLPTVQLFCSRKGPSHELQEGDSLDAILDKVENQDWPARGFLVVQLNAESPNGRSWLPYQLVWTYS